MAKHTGILFALGGFLALALAASESKADEGGAQPGPEPGPEPGPTDALSCVDDDMPPALKAQLEKLLSVNDLPPADYENAARASEKAGFPKAAACLRKKGEERRKELESIVELRGGLPHVIRMGDIPFNMAAYYTGQGGRFREFEAKNPQIGKLRKQLNPVTKVMVSNYPGWVPGAEIVIPKEWNPLAKPMPATLGPNSDAYNEELRRAQGGGGDSEGMSPDARRDAILSDIQRQTDEAKDINRLAREREQNRGAKDQAVAILDSLKNVYSFAGVADNFGDYESDIEGRVRDGLAWAEGARWSDALRLAYGTIYQDPTSAAPETKIEFLTTVQNLKLGMLPSDLRALSSKFSEWGNMPLSALYAEAASRRETELNGAGVKVPVLARILNRTSGYRPALRQNIKQTLAFGKPKGA